MKRKNILLIVFVLTLFVFQQVQAGGSVPSARKKSETNAPLAVGWADVIRIQIYPLNLGTGFIVGSDTCVWDTDPDTPIVDGCGPYEPDFTGTVYQDSTVDCNDKPEDPYPREESGYYYLCMDGDYLPDVLPREINILEIRPPEPEALKALAVAARTFVKHKAPQGEVINNSSASYQVYVPWSRSDEYFGVNYKNEMETAANSTSGQYLSYNGNGNAIDAEFGNDTAGDATVPSPGGEPYLIQVAEPINQSGCRPSTILSLGNGWGLSQLGAIRWAKGQTCPQGTNVDWPASGTTSPIKWDYKQILVHYYTGVNIVGANTPNDRWNLLKYEGIPDTMAAGQEITSTKIWLQNTSTQGWTDAKLGYRWTGTDGVTTWTSDWTEEAFTLSTAVGDHEELTTVSITAPNDGKSYNTLHLDVKANGHWLSEQSPNWPDAQISVTVSAALTATPTITPTATAPSCVFTPEADPYADCVIESHVNGINNQWTDPNRVIGAPSCSPWDFLALGREDGYVIVDMGENEAIWDGDGNDITVHETGKGCSGVNESYQ